MLILFFKSHFQPLLPGWTTHIWVSIHSFMNSFFFPVYFLPCLQMPVFYLQERRYHTEHHFYASLSSWISCQGFFFSQYEKTFSFSWKNILCSSNYDFRDEKVHFRLEAEEIWVYSLGELRNNATSLPFPAFPFPMPLTLSSKISFQQPDICLTL